MYVPHGEQPVPLAAEQHQHIFTSHMGRPRCHTARLLALDRK